MEHGGGIHGFRSDLIVYPNDAVTVAVLANVEAPVHLIRDKLARLAFGESITLNSERNGLALSTEQLTPLAGIYELRPGYEVVIAIQDGQLTGQLTGQAKAYSLGAITESRFFSRTTDAELQFERDATGKVIELLIRQGGPEARARKKAGQ